MAFVSFTDPVESLLQLQRDLDQLSRSPSAFAPLGGAGVFPAINVFQDRDGIVVRAEVPGVPPQAIDVKLEGRTLTVTGERQADPLEKGSFHRHERRAGKFSRSLQLPEDLDNEKAAAECRHGVLTVRIPKREETKPRQVKVQAA